MNKVKAFMKRAKTLLVVATVSAMTVIATSLCASAETVEAGSTSDMSATLALAGEQLMDQFGSMVSTFIPVIIGILGSGLVIFGIFALVKVAKKIFGKVAG